MDRNNSIKSRAFSFRPQRKGELQFKKEVDLLKAKVSANKRHLHEGQNVVVEQFEGRPDGKVESKRRIAKPETVEQMQATSRPPDVQVVLQGSPVLKHATDMQVATTVLSVLATNERKRTVSFSEEIQKRDTNEVTRGKGLAVISTLNTAGPIPLTERKPVAKQLQRERHEKHADVSRKEVDESKSQDKARQSRHSSAHGNKSHIGSARSREQSVSHTTQQLPKSQMVHAVLSHSDLFDEQVDMQTPSDISQLKPTDHASRVTSAPESIRPSRFTLEASAGNDMMISAVRPCSTQSKYDAVMERLEQPVTSEDVVGVQGKMQTLSERPRMQQLKDRSALELRVPQRPPRTDHGSMHDFCNRTQSELLSGFQQVAAEQSIHSTEAVPVRGTLFASHRVPSPVNEVKEEQIVSTSQLDVQQLVDDTVEPVEQDELKVTIASNERMKYVEQLLEMELQSSKEKEIGPQKGKTKRQQEELRLKMVVDQKKWVEHLASLLGQVMGSGEDLAVAGSQQEVVKDASRLCWHPAPPKLNIHPDVIQSHLFPAYQGAVLPTDVKPDDGGAESEDDLDIVTKTEEESEERRQEMDLERTMNRRHMSCVDFTEMSRLRAGPMASLMLGDERLLPGQVVSGVSTASRLVESASGMSSRSTLDMQSWDGLTEPGGEREWQQFSQEELVVRDEQRSETVGRRARRSMASVGMQGRIEEVSSSRRSQQTSSSSRVSLGLKPGMTFQYTAEMGNEWLDSNVQKDFMETEGIEEQPMFPVEVPLRRAQSQPLLSRSAPLLTVPTSFETSMNEIERHRRLIIEAKRQGHRAAEQSGVWTLTSVDLSVSEPTETTPSLLAAKGLGMSTHTDSSLGVSSAIASEYSLTNSLRRLKRILRSGRPSRISKQLWKYMKYCAKNMQQPAARLHRRESVSSFEYLIGREGFPKKRENDVRLGQLRRTTSVVLDVRCFDTWMTSSSSSETNPYNWALLKWDDWFNELYPRDSHASRLKTMNADDPNDYEELINLSPHVDETMQSLQDETTRLTGLIDVSSESTAFHLCRRGALYRIMGRLRDAMDDLNRAIELEPDQLDAYWHRHLLYLTQKNDKAAMTDLSLIIKRNKQHTRAYRSIAQLYEKQGDLTMAIMNYSQVIMLQPTNGEAYFSRAQLYEKKKDSQLALEDYAMASKLMVERTDAIFKHAKYNFDSGHWAAAVKDFTTMLDRDPVNAGARTYRGRAYAKLDFYQKALHDLSIALHLDPSNAVAFYHRGCLLRKANPCRALEDLSVSLLIDDSVNNVMAFLHRGILYTDMKKFDEAIPDFQACIRLDKTIPCSHTSLGLVFMQHLKAHTRAVQCFSNAVKADPTYVRGYVCRGDAYSKLQKLDEAIRDYSRAIHLRPDVPQYHLYRGRLLLRKKELILAAAHVRHAAKLNKASLGSSVTQQAVVQTFLHNYDEAVNIIESAPRSRIDPSLLILKGRTCLKAKRYDDAIKSFNDALDLVATPVPSQHLSCSRAEVHFLIGQCYAELQLNEQALASYNASLKRDPTFAQAYYQRGLVRHKLKDKSSVTDFNRALAIDPSLFQAYLSRAAYYALKGRYTKAILNCSEAVRLQPYSVRTYLYRGALKCIIGVYEQAVSDLERVLWIDDKCTLAYYNRAYCYQQMKQTDKALIDYGSVLLMDNGPSLRVFVNRGLLYFEIKDFANALLDFVAAAEIIPDDPNLHHTIGLCYHKLSRLHESIASYTRALQLNVTSVEAYVCRGNACMDLMTDDGNRMARKDYTRAIHLQPACLQAHVNLGFALQTMGHFRQAWVHFSGACDNNPSYTPGLEGRAIVSLQMGNTYAAFLDLNRAVQVQPTAELLTNRGVTSQFMRDPVNAMKDFKCAIQLDPTYSLAHFNAANICFGQRQFRQALEYYDKAHSLDTSDESVLLNRGIVKVLLGDSSGALVDFNAAVALSPYWAHIYYNRGNLHKSLGQFSEAERDYTKALELQPRDPVARNSRAYVIGHQGRQAEALKEYRTAAELEVT